MRKRRPTVVQRMPFFLGCEGESEQAYGQLLNDLLRAANLAVHLEVVNLSPGAGDPIARLRRANQEIVRRRERRPEFKGKAVLLDSDQVDNNAHRRQEAEQLAYKFGIRIIWQEPCHEAFLLRHLEGYAQHRPPEPKAAGKALLTAWRQYLKPMTKLQLGQRIGLAQVQQAAAVEISLAAFLREITLFP